MLWILALCYQGRGEEEFECGESVRKRKICDENPFFQIIILNKINDRNLLTCSKSYQKQEIKKSGSGTLKFFIRSTFNIASRKGVYYDLSFDFAWYYSIHYPPAWLILSTYFSEQGWNWKGEKAGWVARKNLLSLMKVIYWRSYVMTV